MIRKATWNDLNIILSLYDEIHDGKEAGLIPVIWKRGVYPSCATAEAALKRDDLFVLEKEGRIVGSGIINRNQLDVYTGAPWQYSVPDDQVCVLHTMMISPAEFGKGYAGEFLRFYEEYALEQGCTELRIDTNDKNAPARAMYKKHGYREIGIVTASSFNAIPGIRLVLLEKHLDPKRELYLKQKHTLDIFLEHGAISQAQYDKSFGDLTEKMGIKDENKRIWETGLPDRADPAGR